MALLARKGTDGVMYAVVKALNASRTELALQGSFYHADVTAMEGGDFTSPTATALSVTHATATTHNTAADMAAEFQVKFNLHLADTLAHKVEDTADKSILPAPTHATSEADLATFITDLKTKFNTHVGSTTYHYTADTTNDVGTANATNDATSIALINDLKAGFNAHVLGAPAGFSIDLTGP